MRWFIEEWDTNGNDYISFDEFLVYWNGMFNYKGSASWLKKKFDIKDKNDDGKLTGSE